ncbi:SRPBCC family protein [Micromonospora olivasterospora]|uniref:Polyketide cyclase/dehydrase/lipid transport protein n=1 Tax=Micromonospora olivasterospora TaxID=1880 RepID=A0A562IBV8_MICOL|nr:SRPBCC family protein [Micromonospora olivasterospora]TWH68104.1 polyketide cyclase/dehydrase/lipid transport protein [Micromonospora olivasterospora]
MGRRSTIDVRSVTDTLGIERETQSRGSQGLARFLGWFSLGLGVTTLAARPQVGRLCGVDDSRTAQTVLQAAGVRELGHAAALLFPRRAGWGAWTRVAGDVMDLAASTTAMRNRRGERRRRLMYTTWALAGITAVDLYAAVQVTRGGRFRASNRVQASVTINRSAEDAYRFWHDFENLPRFMSHLESVRMVGDRRSHWTAKAPAGRRVEWDAEIVADRPNEMITWRSVDGATVPNSGSVRFVPAAGGRGTEVRVDLEYAPPGRMFGAALAKIFGEHPQQQICDDLRRFKQVMETGEIARSDGSPDGTNTQQQIKQRPAQPLAMPRA